MLLLEVVAHKFFISNINCHQLHDYGSSLDSIPIHCDNTSVISLNKNPVHHSRTKHIEVRHHFIRDHVENHEIDLRFISTEQQLADIFTKPLPEDRFSYIRRELGMCSIAP